jgi:hypothetical protein
MVPPLPPPPATPFPWAAMMGIACALLAHSFALSSLFSYIAYLVVDVGAAESTDESGWTAGYITGAFMLGRTLSSYHWGIFSDSFGRKSALLCGIAFVGIFSVLFGLSRSLWFALTTRFLLGLGNGIVGVSKAAISEICGAEHEVQGMGYLTGMWSLGFVIGPAAAGLLARPAVQYPDFFAEDGMFGTFPYLLPNIFVASFALIAYLLVYWKLPDTRAGHAVAHHHGESAASIEMTSSLLKAESDVETAMAPAWCTPPASPTSQLRQRSRSMESPIVHHQVMSAAQQREAKEALTIETVPMDGEEDDEGVTAVQKEEDPFLPARSMSADPSPLRRMLSFPAARLALGIYFIFSMISICVDEVVPLWVVSSPEKGGFGLTSADVGKAASVAGVGMGLWQLFVYNRISKAFGYRSVLRGVAVAIVPMYLMLPVWSQLGFARDSMFAMTVANYLCMKIAGNMAFTSIALLTNHSVPVDLLGGMNGLTMTIGSLSKTLGPALGSVTFAFSIAHDRAFPLDFHLTFLAVGACAAGLAAAVCIQLRG